ncbi:MAG TPA: toprim domain-containing protein [Polyangia bacterium]|nr:toprim domain-containing protein [Polyangia bacterium]
MTTSLRYRHGRVREDDELEHFKRDVNLTELAASLGYRFVGRVRSAAGGWGGSTASSISMRNPDSDDKVIIRRDRDGHWTYFSVRTDRDNGTVIDFLQKRGARTLSDVRKQLRAWLREDRPIIPIDLYRRDVAPVARDEDATAATYAEARSIRSRYLAERGIAVYTQRSPRFATNYRVDRRGNVLFAHVDPATGRVVGFEIKNRDFTSFAPGGRKTYWASAVRPHDDRLVVVETAIDALSYHQLFPHARARYISTGGAVGPYALGLIRRAIAAMPAGADLVSATDNDAGGERLHARLLDAAGRPLRRHASPQTKDWNDHLRKLDRERRPRREDRLER